MCRNHKMRVPSGNVRIVVEKSVPELCKHLSQVAARTNIWDSKDALRVSFPAKSTQTSTRHLRPQIWLGNVLLDLRMIRKDFSISLCATQLLLP